MLSGLFRFTSDQKEGLTGVSGVTITTYTMIAFSGKRSEESARVMDQIRSREWGLLLMDEVHVVPAQMFRKVTNILLEVCISMAGSLAGCPKGHAGLCLKFDNSKNQTLHAASLLTLLPADRCWRPLAAL